MKLLPVWIAALLFHSVPASAGQEKYWVFFRDKGSSPSVAAAPDVDARALRRRSKMLTSGSLIQPEDFPVHKPYIDVLQKLGVSVVTTSRWMNAVSAVIPPDALAAVGSLSFVGRVEPVRTVSRGTATSTAPKVREQRIAGTRRLHRTDRTSRSLDYGPSFAQVDAVRVPAVHTLGITGRNVVVGLLDSGFRWRAHRSLEGMKVLKEYDFISRRRRHGGRPRRPARGGFPRDARPVGAGRLRTGSADRPGVRFRIPPGEDGVRPHGDAGRGRLLDRRDRVARGERRGRDQFLGRVRHVGQRLGLQLGERRLRRTDLDGREGRAAGGAARRGALRFDGERGERGRRHRHDAHAGRRRHRDFGRRRFGRRAPFHLEFHRADERRPRQTGRHRARRGRLRRVDRRASTPIRTRAELRSRALWRRVPRPSSFRRDRNSRRSGCGTSSARRRTPRVYRISPPSRTTSPGGDTSTRFPRW